MSMLFIRCPNTRRAISAGRHATFEVFHSSPVFFGRTYCRLCGLSHEWFAKDAWVCDSECSEGEEFCTSGWIASHAGSSVSEIECKGRDAILDAVGAASVDLGQG
jgi:hypothetical protein